jgi:hypothetical protein
LRTNRQAQPKNSAPCRPPLPPCPPARSRWTRALLLQQLLVELFDLLDPDCVRLPMERRVRLAPLAWGSLPRLSQYQKRLRDLAVASDAGAHATALEGLRDLFNSRSEDEGVLTSSLRSVGEPAGRPASPAQPSRLHVHVCGCVPPPVLCGEGGDARFTGAPVQALTLSCFNPPPAPHVQCRTTMANCQRLQPACRAGRSRLTRHAEGCGMATTMAPEPWWR